jgi:hypothetical protein
MDVSAEPGDGVDEALVRQLGPGLSSLKARDSRSYAEVQSRLVDVGRSRRCP